MDGSRKIEVPIHEKYLLTVNEASAYFNIGVKRIRHMAEENRGSFALLMGNRYLIVRERFEAYINKLTCGNDGQRGEQTE